MFSHPESVFFRLEFRRRHEFGCYTRPKFSSRGSAPHPAGAAAPGPAQDPLAGPPPGQAPPSPPRRRSIPRGVGRSLSRSAVRREFVRIGDEGGGPSGYQMDRIHGGNISPARQFMRLRSGSVGSDTVRLGVRLGLPKRVYERTTLTININSWI